MRLIDADKLKEFVATHDYMLRDAYNSSDKGMFTCGIFQAINEQPSVQQWIPCSERLPEDCTEVLVSTKDFVYMAELGTYSDGSRLWEESAERWTIKDVIAWMPLPEPMKGERDD